MLVEIYSDVVCPWCYIGKRRFEAALAEFDGRDEVTVVWRPFQLDPTAPATPTPVLDGYARKFGGPERAAQIIGHVTDVAAEAGLTFHLDVAQRSNTRDAHRLLALALEQGGPALQGDVKERLLQAYFVDGKHVGDQQVLADVAEAAGMDRVVVLEHLASRGGKAELEHELQQGYELGITAVPTFVFDGRWSVPGAQDTSLFARVLEKLVPAEAVEATDATCTDDACEV